ncbi:hypothetical protein L798_10955 [Zootermopsis nevadensis]|uniref:Uncharacterized protein n=1 Tax=Zootermopsis nevadensis TaxID=136037 RepID=A0A067R9H2_ZOONE|nr:hypothetical protein L798_10955 [Zootermopsis nevadensis]
MNVKFLRFIEAGAFNDMKHLRTIYIYQAPALRVISPSVFHVELPHLKILRIVHTSLEQIPDLSQLKTNSILHMM